MRPTARRGRGRGGEGAGLPTALHSGRGWEDAAPARPSERPACLPITAHLRQSRPASQAVVPWSPAGQRAAGGVSNSESFRADSGLGPAPPAVSPPTTARLSRLPIPPHPPVTQPARRPVSRDPSSLSVTGGWTLGGNSGHPSPTIPAPNFRFVILAIAILTD